MTAARWLTKCQSLEIPDVKEGMAATDDLDISAHAWHLVKLSQHLINYTGFEAFLKLIHERILFSKFNNAIETTDFVWMKYNFYFVKNIKFRIQR